MNDLRAASGRHLAADLKAHRIAQEIAVKDVMDVTRMAQDVVEELESSGLLNSPIFNRVYLRSMYGSYAAAIKLPPGPVLDALDAAMKGAYTGGLLDAPAQDVKSDAPADEPVTAEPVPDAPDDEVAHVDDPVPDLDDAPPSPFTTATTRNPIGTPGGGVLLPNTRGLAAAVVAAVLLIALVWFAVSWLLSGPSPDDDGPAEDTTAVLATPAPRPDPVVLPDTLRLYLTAIAEPLDPIRVTIDRDLRRPYWIEHDSTQWFDFRDRIVLEREVENARLNLNGYVIPAHWMQADGRYIVDRAVAQAWFDSLTTQGIFPRRAE